MKPAAPSHENPIAVRDAYIRDHQHLVAITASRLRLALPSTLDFEDLISAGNLGLIRAATLFDPARCVRFATYAITLIKGSVMEMLRNDDWVPRQLREQQKAMEKARCELTTRLGRAPSEEEMCSELGLSVKQYDRQLAAISRAKVVSLSDFQRMDRGPRTLFNESDVETLPADGDVSETVIAMLESEVLRNAIAGLPEREQSAINLYFQERLTFKEIGAKLCVGESRAYQLHHQGLSRLRKALEGQEICL